MFKCNNWHKDYIPFIFIFPLVILLCIGGFYCILDSQVNRHEVPCELMDMFAFECDYDSMAGNYHSVTSMVLQVNKTNYTTITVDRCRSCFKCEHLYSLGHVYNCAKFKDTYKIYDWAHTTDYSMLFIGITLIIIAFIVTVASIASFIKMRSYIIKHVDYIEI